MLDSETRQKIQEEINNLVLRIGTSPNGRDGEVVKIKLDVELRGQEALNYEVSKIFLRNLSYQDIAEYAFRLGLVDISKLIKASAILNEIEL